MMTMAKLRIWQDMVLYVGDGKTEVKRAETLIAEWNIELSYTEIAAIVGGFLPCYIKPDNLVYYSPAAQAAAQAAFDDPHSKHYA